MPVKLLSVGTYKQPNPRKAFDEGAAEITAYDAASKQLFVVNGFDDEQLGEGIDVLDLSDPSKPKLKFKISIKSGSPNSVTVKNGLVAVAIEDDNPQDPGSVAFFKTDGTFLREVSVGSLPDMLTFTPDGSKVLVANEGEPNSYNREDSVDPEGSISIIDLSKGIENLTVATADFKGFNDSKAKLLAQGVRIFGPNATVAQDLEPEFIAVSENGEKAFITLQENNAVAVLDLATNTITEIQPLGLKDFRQPGNGFDASDKDGAINIKTRPVVGMYQPDTIATYTSGGKQYYVTANEGDARDYEGFNEEVRVKDLTLDPQAYPDASVLQQEDNLGRLKSTTVNGDTNGDGLVDEIYAFGTRSFSIWDSEGKQVFDSGSEIELVSATVQPNDFNSTDNENNSFDDRSDDKGPEPEGIAVGKVGNRTYAFVGLERSGGVMVYDISSPARPSFIQFINTRNFEGDPEAGSAGDLAPEGLTFISAEDSPEGVPLLAVANEVSGTVSIFEVKNQKSPWLLGTKGNDAFGGGEGRDFMLGKGGNDYLVGNGGNDRIFGGRGDDLIRGGEGNDLIRGGLGSDIIELAQDQGKDLVLGFRTAQNDKFGLSGGLEYSDLEFQEFRVFFRRGTRISVDGQAIADVVGVQKETLMDSSLYVNL